MRKLDYFAFAKEKTSTGVSNEWVNSNCSDTLTLTVEGTASAFSIEVQGLSNLEGQYQTLFAIAIGGEMDKMKAFKAIASRGVYAVDISGFEKVRIEIKSISGGNVTVFGRMTSGV